MNQLPILVAAANLSKSPSNVRKSSDAVADAQLEANIAAKGVRQNLIGVPVARKKGERTRRGPIGSEPWRFL